MAISWLGQRPGFDPRSVHMRFVVDKVVLGLATVRVLRFIHVGSISQLLHTHLFNTTLMRKTTCRRMENYKNVTFLGYRGALHRFVLSCFFAFNLVYAHRKSNTVLTNFSGTSQCLKLQLTN